MPNSKLFVLFNNRLYQSSTYVKAIDSYLKNKYTKDDIFIYNHDNRYINIYHSVDSPYVQGFIIHKLIEIFENIVYLEINV